jgi:hypothetical protein
VRVRYSLSLKTGLGPAVLPLLLAALVQPPEALAQRLEVSPYVGGLFAEDLELEELDNAPIFGARASLRLVQGLGVEGQIGYAPLSSSVQFGSETREFDVTVWLYEAGLTYTLPLPGPLKPFVGGAVGQATIDPDLEINGQEVEEERKLVASAGVGLRLSVGLFGLRADLRDHLVLDALEETSRSILEGADGETLQAIELSAGLSFLLF